MRTEDDLFLRDTLRLKIFSNRDLLCSCLLSSLAIKKQHRIMVLMFMRNQVHYMAYFVSSQSLWVLSCLVIYREILTAYLHYVWTYLRDKDEHQFELCRSDCLNSKFLSL